MSTAEATRAFVYVRQSINHPEGIERGLDRTSKLIESRGWDLAAPAFVDNAVSATKARGKGTQWAAMIDAVANGEADVIVGVDLDRLIRGLRDLLTLIELGVKVVTVDGELDLTTADGEFRATMLAAVARFEIRRKTERQLRANAFRIAQGKPVAGGRRRFGFEPDHLTLNDVEAGWVRFMHQSIADGASLRKIARDLNEAGVPCVTKGVWNAARIFKIVKNPAYRGFVIHHGRPFPSDLVPVVIEPELAAIVDGIMADPKRRKTSGSERVALMGGIGFCGTCGSPLITAGTKTTTEGAVATY